MCRFVSFVSLSGCVCLRGCVRIYAMAFVLVIQQALEQHVVFGRLFYKQP